MVAAAIVASGAIAAGTSLAGSSMAAGAANKAANLQMQQFQQTQAGLAPYNQTGQSVLGALSGLAMSGANGGGPNYLAQAAAAQPGQMTEAQLQQTPGYQFNLSQGLQSTQNAAAARGLGVSGAAMKGAATYATGLADSTYQNQFNNAQTRFSNLVNLNTAQQSNVQNQFNRLSGVASLGESAGAQTGALGTQAASTAGSYINQAGLASAAGVTGVGNALTGAANNYLGYSLLQQAVGKGGTGGYPTGAVGGGTAMG